MERGRKRSTVFFITLNKVDWTKSDIGEWLLLEPNLIDELCVSEEKYEPPLDSTTLQPSQSNERHHHIYMKTINGFFFDEIQEIFRIFTGEETWSINIQQCKSKKATLLYITKYEKAPFLHNVRVSECSLYTKAWHHAISNYTSPRPIETAHPFIVASGIANKGFIINIIQAHLDQLQKQKMQNRHFMPINRQCKLSNDIAESIIKLENVYIEGPPGYGKTELIDILTKEKKIYKVGRSNNFTFGSVTDDIEILWFEDFVFENFKDNMEVILSLMDRKPTTVSQKLRDDRTLYFTGQFIFISNFPVPPNEERFTRRIKHHYINHKMYECQGCYPDFIPDNQLALFDINDEQVTLDLSDENANHGSTPRVSRFISTGLNNILTDEEIEQLFDSM